VPAELVPSDGLPLNTPNSNVSLLAQAFNMNLGEGGDLKDTAGKAASKYKNRHQMCRLILHR